MKPLQVAAAVVFILLATGCAHTQMAPKPTAGPWTRESPMVPPMTTYGCDAMLARHLGTSC